MRTLLFTTLLSLLIVMIGCGKHDNERYLCPPGGPTISDIPCPKACAVDNLILDLDVCTEVRRECFDGDYSDSECEGICLEGQLPNAAGTCVECNNSDDCVTGVCKTSNNTCVECNVTEDCVNGVCNQNTNMCVTCTEDEGCAGATPACDIVNDECVECTTENSTQCTGAMPVCNTAENECVTCTEDEGCAGATPACDVANQICVECVEHSDCADAEAGRCDMTTYTCTECDTSGGTVLGCEADPDKSACDTNATPNTCVQCIDASTCSSPTPHCGINDICVECTMSSQCAGNCIDGACVTL